MTKEEIRNTAKKQSEDLKFILESDARFYYESFICGAEWYKEYADQQTKALTVEIDKLQSRIDELEKDNEQKVEQLKSLQDMFRNIQQS